MTNRNPQTLTARPMQREILTAREYLRLSPADKRKIANTRIVAPTLGRPGYGGIEVEYRDVLYKVG